jgi:putative glycosyltransferase
MCELGESMDDEVKISIVTTLYKSSAYVEEFYCRITSEAEKTTQSHEIIFVNDGSPDDSLALVLEIADKDKRVRVVDLSRNFGHHNAIVAGLAHAGGDLVFLIDVDLEEQPEWLGDFYKEMQLSDTDLVYGVQVERKGGWLRGNFTGLFYSLFNVLSETNVPKNVCTVRLISRDFVDALLSLKESSLFLAGTFSWVGFRQQALVVDKKKRIESSSYSLLHMLKLLMNAIIGFSSYPLIMAFFVGLSISCLSAAVGLSILFRKLMVGEGVVSGWTSVMVTLWFIGGLTIFFIGLVGLYLSKTYLEAKQRPLYLVRKIYGSEKKNG